MKYTVQILIQKFATRVAAEGMGNLYQVIRRAKAKQILRVE
jgi:hypothetical protein